VSIQPGLVEITLPPSRGRFLTDHATIFTKVLDFEPREEWRGAWHALAHRIPTPAVASEPIRRDEHWTLTFAYEQVTAIGYSKKEQGHVADLLTRIWDTPPPASARAMDWFLYEERACANADRRGHPIARARMHGLVVQTHAAVHAHTDEASPLRRTWLHGDPHARNFGRRADGTLAILDWEHHGLGQRESDAAKYLQTALTEPALGQSRVVPGRFLDAMSDTGLDMDALWPILGARAAGAAAYLHGYGHDTTFPDWSAANIALAERCLHRPAWDLDDWA
jgi:hypothetical protein